MEVVKQWIKVILFFGMLLIILAFLIKFGEEKPHRVVIDGKEYTRIKEWNGKYFEIILLPVDSVKK